MFVVLSKYKIKTGFLLSFYFLLIPLFSIGQDCSNVISGRILDELTEEPLEYANIYLEEEGLGAVSDKNGYFKIQNICPSQYHMRISHIGCEGLNLFVNIQNDTFIQVELHHHSELLNEVEVHGARADQATQSNSSIQKEDINSSSNESLAQIASKIAGVTLIKNGGNIAKPIINGLYGNRISILNNGIAQSGQQWGNDHAPEIDPF